MNDEVFHGKFEPCTEVPVLKVLNVYYNGSKVPLRSDLVNHSVEFNVGYNGSGPAALALSLLSQVMGDDFAIQHGRYQRFKEDVVAALPQGKDFQIGADAIRAWAKKRLEDEVKERDRDVA